MKKATSNQVKAHADYAGRADEELSCLRAAFSMLAGFLKLAGAPAGHSASAMRLITIDAVTTNDDLEYHLAKLREAGAGLPKGLEHCDGKVACWGCRAPLVPTDAEFPCPLGAECRYETLRKEKQS